MRARGALIAGAILLCGSALSLNCRTPDPQVAQSSPRAPAGDPSAWPVIVEAVPPAASATGALPESGETVELEAEPSEVPPQAVPDRKRPHRHECAPDDLLCAMQTSLGRRDGGTSTAGPQTDAGASRDVPFDRAAAVEMCKLMSAEIGQCPHEGRSGLTLRMRMTISPDGRVRSAQVEAPPDDAGALVQCMKAAALKGRIPPFSGAVVTITKAFRF